MKPIDPNDLKPMPTQGPYDYASDGRLIRGCELPAWIVAEAYAQYAMHYGTAQSFERLCIERGGFGREELLDLLAGGDGAGRALAKVRDQRTARGAWSNGWRTAFGLLRRKE